MKTYTFGDVILAQFPYVSGAPGKKRPALVLIDTGDDDIVTAIITSKPARNTPCDIHIKNWQQAHLPKPSVVRIHKIYTRRKDMVEGNLGRISHDDSKQVKIAIKKLWQTL